MRKDYSNNNNLIKRITSIYRYLERCLCQKVDFFKLKLQQKMPNKLDEEIEIFFIKYLKHDQSKYIKNKTKFSNILRKNGVDKSHFIKVCSEAKIYFDLNRTFFDNIDFKSLTIKLSKFGLNKLNYCLLEKVINTKLNRNLEVEEHYKKYYLETLRSLENSQFFDETLRLMNFLPDEKSKLAGIKTAIDNFLLEFNLDNFNFEEYKCFLNNPLQEITQQDNFKIKILSSIEFFVKSKFWESKQSIYQITNEFICETVSNINNIKIIDEIDRIITIYGENSKKHESEVQVRIKSLFFDNKINDNPDNLFHFQIRRVFCKFLNMKEAEEIIFLRILSIYKCKNDMEMIGKYIKLYEESFKDSNSPQYFYTCLKYIHFQNKPIQLNNFFKSYSQFLTEKDYLNLIVKNVFEAKSIFIKFQSDFNSKHYSDDRDHSNVLTFLGKNKHQLYIFF